MKKIIAYNEVGRAIVSAVKNGIDSVEKITILPRSGYLGGYTKINPDDDIVSSGLISKKLLFSKFIASSFNSIIEFSIESEILDLFIYECI